MKFSNMYLRVTWNKASNCSMVKVQFNETSENNRMESRNAAIFGFLLSAYKNIQVVHPTSSDEDQENHWEPQQKYMFGNTVQP